jgi:hypothetical protein
MEVEVDGIVCNCSSAFELTPVDLPNSLSFLMSIGGSLFLCTKNSDFFFDSSDLLTQITNELCILHKFLFWR